MLVCKKIPQNLNRTVFIPKSQLISPCENVTNLAYGEVSWPENFQMISWSPSAISKIQKLLVYWVAKLCLAALCTSLALTNTIPAGIRQYCNGAKISQAFEEFQNFFSEADDWQAIFGPCSVNAKKRSNRHFWCSTDLSSPKLTQPLDLLPLAISRGNWY